MSKTFIGSVVSDKMQKTIVVEVKHHSRHPLYGKVLEKSTRLYVHDEEEKAVMGDRVEVVETRPLSKKKRFKLVKIINQEK